MLFHFVFTCSSEDETLIIVFYIIIKVLWFNSLLLQLFLKNNHLDLIFAIGDPLSLIIIIIIMVIFKCYFSGEHIALSIK